MVKRIKVDHHRNGISGVGFNLVHFSGVTDAPGADFVGIVFSDKDDDKDTGYIAVFETKSLCEWIANTEPQKGYIELSAWRGDHFERDLREEIDAASQEQRDKFLKAHTHSHYHSVTNPYNIAHSIHSHMYEKSNNVHHHYDEELGAKDSNKN